MFVGTIVKKMTVMSGVIMSGKLGSTMKLKKKYLYETIIRNTGRYSKNNLYPKNCYKRQFLIYLLKRYKSINPIMVRKEKSSLLLGKFAAYIV